MRVVSLYTGMVLRYTGTFRCDGAPRLRGRRQVVTALSVHCKPPYSGIRIGVRKLTHEVAGRPSHGDLPVLLTLRFSSNHVFCLITHYSLHGYIRIKPAPLWNIVLFFVFLLSLRLARVCVTLS